MDVASILWLHPFGECQMPSERWTWKLLLPSQTYYSLELDGWPGWEKPNGESVTTISFTIVKGHGKESRDMALLWDDQGHGQFWYRDFTDSGLPYVEDGEEYRSRFWFQFRDDAEELTPLPYSAMFLGRKSAGHK
jgi:hypothetical protein